MLIALVLFVQILSSRSLNVCLHPNAMELALLLLKKYNNVNINQHNGKHIKTTWTCRGQVVNFDSDLTLTLTRCRLCWVDLIMSQTDADASRLAINLVTR